MKLSELGWNDIREGEFTPYRERGCVPGRVAAASSTLYDIFIGEGSVRAVVTGLFRHDAEVSSDYPVPGDWVALRREGDASLVEAILPRRTIFARKAAGRRNDEQLIAANLDILCIVASLDGGRGFTARGIERYLVLARQGGISPVVVLNKADLCHDTGSAVLLAGGSSAGAPVLAVSARTGEGLEELSRLLRPGITVAFTGPSGVGKSSLVNALSGGETLVTGEVREADLRGRHTTTRGELFLLPGGTLVIDTPGLRELALGGGAGDALDDAFPEISGIAGGCRFRNCTHTGEPGCAVGRGLADGRIDRGRYRNYLDMKKELEYLDSREDPRERRRRKEDEKKLSRMVREFKDRDR